MACDDPIEKKDLCCERSDSGDDRLVSARSIVDCSRDMIIAVDKDRKIIEFNKAAERTFGYTADEMIGRGIEILYADPAEGAKVYQAVCKEGCFQGEITNKDSDGRTFKSFLSACILCDKDGDPLGIMGISRDMTELKDTEDALKKSERFLNTIFDSIKDPFCIIDRDYRIIRANEAYIHIKGKKASDLLGKKCFETLLQREDVCHDCVVRITFESGDPCAKDKHVRMPDGEDAWVEIYTYPILGEAGEISHVIEYTRDITDRWKSEQERKRLIQKLEYLSSTDSLTGVLNRRALLERLRYEVDRAGRYGSPLSLMLCDVDNFKEINDSHGHAEGDRVLQIITGILKTALRKTDIVGRYGGDEFMSILPETGQAGAYDIAERIRSTVESTGFQMISGESVSLSVSIGITSCEQASDIKTIDEIIMLADDGLYEAKRTGRNRVCSVRP